MFSYLSLASGALVLVFTVIADNKPMELCYLCYIYLKPKVTLHFELLNISLLFLIKPN